MVNRAALDDDGKLYCKYSNKRVNAKKEGLECKLSFDQFCQLVADANLVSSQLGFSGDGYVLARYNDIGDYEIGNCRFITQKENAKEKKISDFSREVSREVGRKNIRKYNAETSVEVRGCNIKKSKKFQDYLKRVKMQHLKRIPSKEELEQLIIKKVSFVQMGKRYGVTDNAVRKWCKKRGLPFRMADIKDYIERI